MSNTKNINIVMRKKIKVIYALSHLQKIKLPCSGQDYRQLSAHRITGSPYKHWSDDLINIAGTTGFCVLLLTRWEEQNAENAGNLWKKPLLFFERSHCNCMLTYTQ